MMKKWIKKIFPKNKNRNKTLVAQRYSLAEHPLRKDMLSFAAEKIITRLHQSGFEAYIVGGAVRDLLLGKEPKDYDIATNARPEEIRKVFRRSRIIGRRFQIVHVMVGAETIEVTTFRGGRNTAHNEHGRIMRDNEFGSQEEDAARRDFTCNALYYDPIHETIIDYHHGIEAIHQKRLLMIGTPSNRFKEDPVRILRVVRLAAKLQLTIDDAILDSIPECAGLIAKEPVARLFDEITKELFSGYAINCLDHLMALGIPANSHPLFKILEQKDKPDAQNFIRLALSQTDKRIHEGKSVSMSFVLACILWSSIRLGWQENKRNGMKSAHALQAAITDSKESTEKGWGVPHRFSAVMREIWQLQSQFEITQGKRPFRLLAQPRFRSAYDFLLLRAQCGEVPLSLAQWWTDFQEADTDTRESMVANTKPSMTTPSTRKRRRRKPASKDKQIITDNNQTDNNNTQTQ